MVRGGVTAPPQMPNDGLETSVLTTLAALFQIPPPPMNWWRFKRLKNSNRIWSLIFSVIGEEPVAREGGRRRLS